MVCLDKTDRCINCNEHFQQLFPSIKEVVVTKHFFKDAPDFNIELVTGCKNENFEHLHKFEKKIGSASIFRSLKDHEHIVYAIDNDRLIFLRAFKNFKDYERFLSDKKQISKLLI